MKNIGLALVVVLMVWLQAGFLGGLRPLGVVPDPLIVVVIYAGLMREPAEAVGMATLGGLLLDLASGADFGLRTAFYVVLALLVLVAKQAGADFDKVGLVLLMTATAAIIFNLAVLAGPWLRHDLVPWTVVAESVVLSIVLNLVLVFLLRPLLVRVFRRSSGVPLMGSA